MRCQLILNWKSFAVLGVSAIGIILACKVQPEQAMEALNNMFCAAKAISAGNSND